MSFYQISDLEQLTGIKAHTIRIWEKRYNLIEPHRSETNIRFYDDEQLKKILNVSTLINHGLKISIISKFSLIEIEKEILSIYENQIKITNEVFVNDLTIAMLELNEINFEKSISNAISKFGIFGAMVNVVYPFLNKVGLLWNVNKTKPFQEHFASNLIKQKLHSLIDNLPYKKSKHTYLLFLPENEFHEIGLLFSNYILRAKGIKTIYLGQNVPYQNIETAIHEIKPTHLLTMIVSNLSIELFNQKSIFKIIQSKKIKCLVAGRIDLLTPFEKKYPITILKNPSTL
jgi:DNA-binding transcriptional MerR regulator